MNYNWIKEKVWMRNPQIIGYSSVTGKPVYSKTKQQQIVNGNGWICSNTGFEIQQTDDKKFRLTHPALNSSDALYGNSFENTVALLEKSNLRLINAYCYWHRLPSNRSKLSAIK